MTHYDEEEVKNILAYTLANMIRDQNGFQAYEDAYMNSVTPHFDDAL